MVSFKEDKATPSVKAEVKSAAMNDLWGYLEVTCSQEAFLEYTLNRFLLGNKTS